MKSRFSVALLSGLAFTLVLPACGGSKKNPFGEPKQQEQVSLADAGAVEKPVEARKFAPPDPDQTLYLFYLRDAQDRPVKGVLCSLLQQAPDGQEIRQPRRKTVVGEAISGLDGIGPVMSEADGKRKFAWVGGEGVYPPSVYPVEAATGGNTVKVTLRVPIEPIATLVFLSPEGELVPNAIVTFKPVGGSGSNENIGNRPSQSDNYGATKRSDDSGECKFTRPVGRYMLIANDEDGHHRIYKIIDWKGDTAPMQIQLPETSMKASDVTG